MRTWFADNWLVLLLLILGTAILCCAGCASSRPAGGQGMEGPTRVDASGALAPVNVDAARSQDQDSTDVGRDVGRDVVHYGISPELQALLQHTADGLTQRITELLKALLLVGGALLAFMLCLLIMCLFMPSPANGIIRNAALVGSLAGMGLCIVALLGARFL